MAGGRGEKIDKGGWLEAHGLSMGISRSKLKGGVYLVSKREAAVGRRRRAISYVYALD